MILNNSRKWTLLILFFVSSCLQNKPAQILVKGQKFYGENYYKDNNNKESSQESESRKTFKTSQTKNLPTNSDNSNNINSNTRSVTINSGDTLYSIAIANQVPIRDLIDYNNLQHPYLLKVGSTILIPTARYHQIEAGDTLYGISRTYNMNINDLIKLNNLEEPYTIKTGNKLRISGFATATSQPIQQAKIDQKEGLSQKQNSTQKETQKYESAAKELTSKNNQFTWPVKGKVISGFGSKSGGLYNDGINISGKIGEEVKAVEDGVVAYVGNELRGYGNLIIIKHSDGWISAYAHLQESAVKRGDKVSKGSKIALLGSTGNVSSPQLYFGIRKGRKAVNPELYLK